MGVEDRVPDDAEVVRSACRRTLERRGARVFVASVSEGPDGSVDRWMWHLGVADPPRGWTIAEFWDFDRAVQIEAPDQLAQRATTREIVRDLWRLRRRKRAYDRSHPGR